MPARIPFTAALVAGVLAASVAVRASDDKPVRARKPADAGTPRKRPPLSKEAQQAAAKLKKTLPPKSEARLMLDAVLQGRVGPNSGWFRVAKSKTRFAWKYVAGTYDRNNDRKVTRNEFGGQPYDFRRLDRNRDRVLTAADFEGSGGRRSSSPGAMLFYMADRDGNGHVTKEEFAALFKSLDDGRLGFLSLDDLEEGLQPPPARKRPRKRKGGPTRSGLVLALARQELGALQPGPDLNENAPDFSLRIVNDVKTVTLSKEVGDKPVVLIFGSFT